MRKFIKIGQTLWNLILQSPSPPSYLVSRLDQAGADCRRGPLPGAWAAAWWYRNTLKKLHEAEDQPSNPHFGYTARPTEGCVLNCVGLTADWGAIQMNRQSVVTVRTSLIERGETLLACRLNFLTRSA